MAQQHMGAGVVVVVVADSKKKDELRWSSSGGGIRAMVANIGYAHLFHKLGLLEALDMDTNSDTNTTTTTTTNTDMDTDRITATTTAKSNHTTGNTTTNTTNYYFSGISTNSGGTWFGLQFFFSPLFYGNVVTSNTTRTQQFIVDWLLAYRDYTDTVPLVPRNLLCRALHPILRLSRRAAWLQDIQDFCDFLTYYGPSYPNYIRGMLRATSTHYHDPDLIHRFVNTTNRVRPLQQVEYAIQIGMATNSKFTRTTPNETTDRIRHPQQQWYYNYIGPFGYPTTENNTNDVTPVFYAIPLALQYVTPAVGTRSYYEYAVEAEHLPLQSHWSDQIMSSTGDDWEDYPLYHHHHPYNTSTNSIYVNNNHSSSPRRNINQTQTLSPFFGGRSPTVLQMAAASASVLYPIAATTPSVSAQWYSMRTTSARGGIVSSFVHRLWNAVLFGTVRGITQWSDLALCTQWPDRPCGPTDTYFLDGSSGDGPALAGNIAQYQKNHTLNETIKVIVTNHNYYEDTNVKFLSYFNTTFNQDIEPGALVWAPTPYGNQSFLSVGGGNLHPWRSMQIFSDYMDDAILQSQCQPIPRVNLTTATFHVTTIRNRAFGVTGGQSVQILLLQLNSNIPTNIFLPSANDQYRIPLVDMANDIMTSTVLLDRIAAFIKM